MDDNFKARKKRSYAILIIAILCGLIYLSPHFRLIKKYGFNGYEKTLTGDEVEYAALIARPYNNPYILEYKNYPTPNEMLGIYLLQPFKYFFGIPATFLVWDFLGPFLIFLTLTILLLTVSKGRYYWQILFAVLIYTLYRYGFEHFVYVMLGGSYKKWYSIQINHNSGRLINPALTSPYLFFNLYLVVKSYFSEIHLKNKFIRSIFLGILGGSLIFLRAYDAFLYYVFMGFILVYLLFRKNVKKLKEYFIHISILLCIISIKIFSMFVFKLKNSEFMVGLIEQGRRISFQSILFFAAILFTSFILFHFLRFCQRKLKSGLIFDLNTFYKIILFILLLIFTGVLGDNIQIITGFNIESWHWFGTIIFPLATLLFSFFLAMYLGLFLKPGFYLTFAILFGIVLNLIYVNTYLKTYEKDLLQDKLYGWIKQNTKHEDIIGVNYYPSMIVSYTERPVFIPYMPYSPGVSIAEFFDRYFLFQGLLGYNLDSLKNKLDPTYKVDYPKNYARNIFRFDDPSENSEKELVRQLLSMDIDTSSTQDLILAFTKRYSNFSCNDFLKEISKKYKLDYIVILPKDIHEAESLMRLKNCNYLKLISKIENRVYIYKNTD